MEHPNLIGTFLVTLSLLNDEFSLKKKKNLKLIPMELSSLFYVNN